MVWQYVIAPVYMCMTSSDLHQRSIHCSQELQPPGEKSGQLTGQLQSGTCNNLLHVILLCICIENEKKPETIWGDTEHKISQTDLDKLVYFRLIHGVWKPRFLNTCSCIQTSWIISNTYNRKLGFFWYWLFLTCKRLTKMNYFYECHETLSRWLFSEKYIDRILSDRFYSSII